MTNEAAKVKICGIREEVTLQAMHGLPVDYIGFVFAPSKRQVTPEQAALLQTASRSIPMAGERPPLTVGVFVNPSMEELAKVLSFVPLDVVQLHGEESPEFCREVRSRFRVEVWRALPVNEHDEEHSEHLSIGVNRLSAYRDAVSTVLLDTAGGGTGRAFRWDLIPSYQAAAEQHGLRLFVAGGLAPDNAQQLIRHYRPAGVDISSGVETDGIKDILKITAFAERVKGS